MTKMIEYTWFCEDCEAENKILAEQTDYLEATVTCKGCNKTQVISGLTDGDIEEPVVPMTPPVQELQSAAIPRVVIEVRGGVAYVSKCPEGIQVKIIDYDNEEYGETAGRNSCEFR